jgi:hypothetical protein
MQTSLWVVTQKLEKNILQVARSEQFQKTKTEPKLKQGSSEVRSSLMRHIFESPRF